jgi:methylated-DNA-[protein]-cysteine S-methyltransferase
MELFVDRFDSLIGGLRLVWNECALVALDFDDCEERMYRLLLTDRKKRRVPLVHRGAPDFITDPLRAYFSGEFEALNQIAVDAYGTPFQRQVWSALRDIPPGVTISYGELAARIGRPGASRAVGLANGSNPVAIVVPCHRVIGADGSLTGYGGGIERKRWLLAHERAGFLMMTHSAGGERR